MFDLDAIPLETRKLSPAEVLAVLRKCYGGMLSKAWSLDTPATESVAWMELNFFYAHFEDWLNNCFGCCLKAEQIQKVVGKHYDENTLGDFCRLVSERSAVPVLRPMRILGKACEPAGVFAGVRNLLKAAGADVSELHPSSSLLPFYDQHKEAFLRLLPIAPQALGKIYVNRPWTEVTQRLGCLALFSTFAGACVAVPLAQAGWITQRIAVVLLVVTILLNFLHVAGIKHFRQLERPLFAEGSFRTFREFCAAVAAERNEALTGQ